MQFVLSMLSERIDVLDSSSALKEVVAVPMTSVKNMRGMVCNS